VNKISNKEDLGFLAHEVQENIPDLVEGEKDGETKQSDELYRFNSSVK
jgi:hypothetical protein